VPERCLIVDDSAAFMAAARAILEGQDFTVVGQASTSADALERAEQLDPDVILIDIDLGEESGFDVARDLSAREVPNGQKLVLISAHPETDFADLIADSPATGFIAKSELSPRALAGLLSRT
jgi:DNA-binding NarL/FixJ family response regulator